MRQFSLHKLLLLGALGAGLSSVVGAATTMDFVYSGRFSDANGEPASGPVALQVDFYRDNQTSAPLLTVTQGLAAVPLQEGAFQIHLALSTADYAKVFTGPAAAVWVQITDLTHRPQQPYVRQQVVTAPYAARVPVDGGTVSFGSDGRLTVGPNGTPGANQFVTKNSSGEFVWATPATSATALQGQAVAATAPKSGQALVFNGEQWQPQDFNISGPTSVTATAPLTATSSGTSIAVQLGQASGSSAGFVTAADWHGFQSALSATGGSLSGSLAMNGLGLHGLATPTAATAAAPKNYVDGSLAKNGSVTLTGSWNVGAYDLSATGNLLMAQGKVLGLSANTNDPTGLTAADKGKLWYNTTLNQIRYFDGTAVQTVPKTVGDVTSLNGLTANVQVFATGSGGLSPSFNSSGTTHTFSSPLASGAGVTGGLLANSDYAAFKAKLSGMAAGTGLTTSLSSGTATVALASLGSAGTYAQVLVNGSGLVTAGPALTASAVPELPASAITTGHVPLASGGTGLSSVPGAGQLLIGNGAGFTLGSLASGPRQGIAVASGAGSVALDTAQDLRFTAAPTFASMAVTGLGAGLLKTTASTSLATAAAADVTTVLGYAALSSGGDTMTGALSVAALILPGKPARD